jgi:hypothetical protein
MTQVDENIAKAAALAVEKPCALRDNPNPREREAERTALAEKGMGWQAHQGQSTLALHYSPDFCLTQVRACGLIPVAFAPVLGAALASSGVLRAFDNLTTTLFEVGCQRKLLKMLSFDNLDNLDNLFAIYPFTSRARARDIRACAHLHHINFSLSGCQVVESKQIQPLNTDNLPKTQVVGGCRGP